MKFAHKVRKVSVIIVFLHATFSLISQIIPVGNGSYTNVFPGVDEANRNTFPSGTPYVSGVAATKPVPTNDWWSSKVKEPHVSNLFNYPLALATKTNGLMLSYIIAPSGANGSSQPMDDAIPVIVGVSGLNAASASVSDYSDFTVSMNWANDTHGFSATVGIAMPFIYFTKNETDIAQITINEGIVTINAEMLIVENAHHGSDFVFYAPAGSVWEQNGKIYTSTLNGNNFWSVAHISPNAPSLTTVANEYKKYAFVFPKKTLTSWLYDESTSKVRTTFSVTCDVKEGNDSIILLGLLPHQWAHLASDSPKSMGYSYSSIRGEIKTLEANTFYIENTFKGILPTLPYLNNYSQGFSPALMDEKIQSIKNDGLSTWTDSYNEGQVMNRLIQTARIADLTGDTVSRNKILKTIKERLEDWLTAESGEVAFLFYYNVTWSTLIGYPAGHGQDGNINDHHFHWGYFIHAAAFIEQFQPGWANQWGEMVNYLIRDAASSNRNDTLFPFLRNFSPYAGHCWANGFATFPFGNDQESTSESMQFNSSLIHWGTITGNDSIRDLGIYLYTTEQSAIEEYWMDINDRIFKPEYNYSIVSRVWGNGYDNQTFWTGDIAAAYGIEMYPIHGGSLYLGHNLAYSQKLWNEISQNTGILSNAANDNLWHDIMWEYLAFFNPEKAIELYDSYPDRSLKFGISEAQTYYWLHAMNALGSIDTSVTANYPIAAVFNKNGELTYTAHNYSNTPITIDFSDGFSFEVPAYKMVSSKDVAISGVLSSSFQQAFINGSIELTVAISGGSASKIEFYDGEKNIGNDSELPYSLNVANLSAGKHHFFARIYEDDKFSVSNIVTVIVGRQLPFTGTAISIPGIIESGKYDKFEGGNAQGVSYSDASVKNEDGFRPNEYVDASNDVTEGAVVGWITSGEWLEYTIDVQLAGYYSMSFRFASDNNSGGGPFYLELDGKQISDAIYADFTDGWEKWQSKTIQNLPFSKGEHVLRLIFASGEFNLGRMEFAYQEALDYAQPVADAGPNILVILPDILTTLDASASFDPESNPLTYKWKQIYGPSIVDFSNDMAITTQMSNLLEGVYSINLQVSNTVYCDDDELLVIVSQSNVIAPFVSINYPETNAEFIEGEHVIIVAEASDLDGTIEKVEFFANESKVGTITTAPYEIEWTASVIGSFSLTAVAFDNDGNATTSQAVQLTITKAPPCDGESYNGDYKYLFTSDDNNPSLTFIPSRPGMGNPTCILYYGTNPSQPFSGMNVVPDTPFKLNASEGTTIYFYYTYSHPDGGERNTADHMDSYVVGSCVSESDTTSNNEIISKNVISYYPNPVKSTLTLHLPENTNTLSLYSINGRLLKTIDTNLQNYEFDMQHYRKGVYVLKVQNNSGNYIIKLVKE